MQAWHYFSKKHPRYTLYKEQIKMIGYLLSRKSCEIDTFLWKMPDLNITKYS